MKFTNSRLNSKHKFYDYLAVCAQDTEAVKGIKALQNLIVGDADTVDPLQ